MDSIEDEAKSVTEYEPAILKEGIASPVWVESLTVTEVNGRRTLIIKTRRDLSVRLRSYTLAYCFLGEPVEDVANPSAFRRKIHNDANINTEEVMYFTGALPAGMEIPGCGAYIAGVEYEDGSVRSFVNTDYVTPGNEPFDDGIEWAENADDYAALLSGSYEADYTSTPFADSYSAEPYSADAYASDTSAPEDGAAPESSGSAQNAPADNRAGPLPPERDEAASPATKKAGKTPAADKKIGKKAGEGAKSDRKSDKKAEKTADTKGDRKADAKGDKTADTKADAGKRAAKKKKAVRAAIIAGAAVCLVSATAIGLFVFSKHGTAATLETLMDEGRYTEAYKIAEHKGFDDLRTGVAQRAMRFYLDSGDFRNAYVYGELAGDASEVTSAALGELAASGEDALGSDVFPVALKSQDKAAVDAAVGSLASTLAAEGKYGKAMNTTLFINDDAARTNQANSIFYQGVSHYTGEGQYESAAELIRRYGTMRSDDGSVDVGTVSDAISHCAETGDSASALLLAGYFRQDTSQIRIAPGDLSVQRALAEIYPLLTEDQRRAYHAKPLAFCKEAFYITDGALSGTDITDAVGVDTYEFRTAVLHADGRVSMLENDGHNEIDELPGDLHAVQAVCGLHHTVVLRADGTCAAFGSDDYGQCDVSGWTDIVRLAAGRYFTLGLRSDGTVVACGSDLEGQCRTADYRNVVDIGACDQTAVMLFADGSVRLQGDVTMGLYGADSLADVEAISCRANTVAVRFRDGGYRIICAADGAAGDSAEGASGAAGDAQRLRGAQAFCAGSTGVAYIDESGSLQVMGEGAPG